MGDNVVLDDFLEEGDFGLALISKYNIGSPERVVYNRKVERITKILACTQVDEANPGFATLNCENPDASVNYYPSMFALQLLLEDVKMSQSDAEYPDILVPTTQPIVDKLVTALYAIDRRTGANWTKTDSRFHLTYPNVYKILRMVILDRRNARRKVFVTQTVEKKALDQLLADAEIAANLSALEAQFPEPALFTSAQSRAKLVEALQRTKVYINQTLGDKFIEEVEKQQ